jgi:predicted nucleic acid-binding protein
LDTNPIIYAFEDHPTFGSIVRPTFESIERGIVEGYLSTVSIVEVLTAPLRASNALLAENYRRFFREAANISKVPLSTSIAQKAAELRAQYDLKTADAIVAATALESRCEVLLTNDNDLKRLTEVKVLFVGDYVTGGSRRS